MTNAAQNTVRADAETMDCLSKDLRSILYDHIVFAVHTVTEVRVGVRTDLHSRVVGAAVQLCAVHGQALAPDGSIAAIYIKGMGAGDGNITAQSVDSIHLLAIRGECVFPTCRAEGDIAFQLYGKAVVRLYIDDGRPLC